MAKQAKTAFLHGPTVWKSPIVGIEPATFRSESAALTTAPRDPHSWSKYPSRGSWTHLVTVTNVTCSIRESEACCCSIGQARVQASHDCITPESHFLSTPSIGTVGSTCPALLSRQGAFLGPSQRRFRCFPREGSRKGVTLDAWLLRLHPVPGFCA